MWKRYEESDESLKKIQNDYNMKEGGFLIKAGLLLSFLGGDITVGIEGFHLFQQFFSMVALRYFINRNFML